MSFESNQKEFSKTEVAPADGQEQQNPFKDDPIVQEAAALFEKGDVASVASAIRLLGEQNADTPERAAARAKYQSPEAQAAAAAAFYERAILSGDPNLVEKVTLMMSGTEFAKQIDALDAPRKAIAEAAQGREQQAAEDLAGVKARLQLGEDAA